MSNEWLDAPDNEEAIWEVKLISTGKVSPCLVRLMVDGRWKFYANDTDCWSYIVSSKFRRLILATDEEAIIGTSVKAAMKKGSLTLGMSGYISYREMEGGHVTYDGTSFEELLEKLKEPKKLEWAESLDSDRNTEYRALGCHIFQLVRCNSIIWRCNKFSCNYPSPEDAKKVCQDYFDELAIAGDPSET